MIKVFELSSHAPPVEVVERKGLGHPDTLADAIAERASALYSKYFFNTFEGRFAHHWFDKVVLIGGESRLEYGRGELIKPYEVIVIGKGVRRVGSHEVPVQEIFKQAATSVFEETLEGFNPDSHLIVTDRVVDYKGPGQQKSRYRPQSADELFCLGKSPQRSNDCNLCVSYWPLSPLEDLVLRLEGFLNSTEFKQRMLGSAGSDIKIVGDRVGEVIRVLINFPFIANKVADWEDYISKVKMVETQAREFALKECGIQLAELTVNPERAQGRPYLTALGSVADTGDIGVVGRGNRINGLITPTRPMSIEAWAGKNPIDHTGKLYTFLCAEIAKSVYETTGLPNQVILTSSKEAAVDRPDLVSIGLMGDGKVTEALENAVHKIVWDKLGRVAEVTLACIFGDSNPLSRKLLAA